MTIFHQHVHEVKIFIISRKWFSMSICVELKDWNSKKHCQTTLEHVNFWSWQICFVVVFWNLLKKMFLSNFWIHFNPKKHYTLVLCIEKFNVKLESIKVSTCKTFLKFKRKVKKNIIEELKDLPIKGTRPEILPNHFDLQNLHLFFGWHKLIGLRTVSI